VALDWKSATQQIGNLRYAFGNSKRAPDPDVELFVHTRLASSVLTGRPKRR
jgi:hypothetical protein